MVRLCQGLSLRTAAKDAAAIADVLQREFSYGVTQLINASRTDLVGALDQLRRQLTERHNLLICSGISQIERDFSDFRRRFEYKNQHLEAMLEGRS